MSESAKLIQKLDFLWKKLCIQMSSRKAEIIGLRIHAGQSSTASDGDTHGCVFRVRQTQNAVAAAAAQSGCLMQKCFSLS